MVFPRTESNSTEELPANIAYFGVRLAPARARHSSVARDLWSQQNQSCSVSKETFDLTVTRGMLWFDKVTCVPLKKIVTGICF